jgi:hypothetical protein
MDSGFDTLVYIIIAVIFVVQATRKRNVINGNPRDVSIIHMEEAEEELSRLWEEIRGKDLAANQVSEPVYIICGPPVFT